MDEDHLCCGVCEAMHVSVIKVRLPFLLTLFVLMSLFAGCVELELRLSSIFLTVCPVSFFWRRDCKRKSRVTQCQ